MQRLKNLVIEELSIAKSHNRAITKIFAADVNLTVDGKKVTAPAGTLLIEACKTVGIEVPSFCYYPNLSLQGACRMCLVKVEKMPKLQTACTTVVGEGMIVTTDSDEIKQARKSMLEMLLGNHPLDCPVCDAGGECELQDMTFSYGAAESKFMEAKNHKEEQQWSPVVFFDRPRCILCYRCVRVCGEGMDVWALGVQNRGVSSLIAPNKEDHLECEECGMCIDICPVGALTSGAYRYKTRPWEMKHVGTVCTHCGDGCKTTLGVRRSDTGMEIVRGDNRDKSGTNGDFLCIKGRYAFDFANHEERLTKPLIRKNGKLTPATWEEAFELVGKTFAGIRDTEGGAAIGVIGSTRTTNEEAYLLSRSSPRDGAGRPTISAIITGRRTSLHWPRRPRKIQRNCQHGGCLHGSCDSSDWKRSDGAASAAGLADSQQRTTASRQALCDQFRID